MECEPRITAEFLQEETNGYLKIFPVILMIDVSNSMSADNKTKNIQVLFYKIVGILKEIEHEEQVKTYSTRMAVMLINDTPCWLKDITYIDCYSMYVIECENTEANYKEALVELNKKLSRQEFMASKGKIGCPLIIFITDNVNSLSNCSEQIENLNNNGWFRSSTRLVYFGGNETDLAIQNIGFHKFVSSTEGLLLNESDLQDMIWDGRPRTIGGKNSFSKNTLHDIRPGFVESEFSDFGGFGGFYGDFGSFEEGEWL